MFAPDAYKNIAATNLYPLLSKLFKRVVARDGIGLWRLADLEL
jgi:hypothetical protein